MKIEGTKSSPSVSIENGIFEIKGRSIPEDTHDFYSPIIHVIQDYLKNPYENTVLQFHLEYINSGSKKYITNILSTFNEYYLHGNDVKIFWHYDFDDDSMLELGHDLQSMVKIPFQLIEVK
jgi:hypothetical protein